MLDEAPQLGEERGADAPSTTRWSHESVIARRLPGTTAPSLTTGSSRTWPTARMAPSGGLMTAENSSIAEHPQVRDRERAVGHLLGLELARAGARGELAHLAGDGDDALLVGVAHDRRDEPVGDGDRDRDVDALVDEDGLGREARVALGHAHERDGAGLDEQIVDATP